MNEIYNVNIIYENANSYDVADYLVSKGMNLTKGKFFKVKGSSIGSNRLPEYTLDNTSQYFCSSQNDNPPWIHYEFTTSSFLIRGYSIKSTFGNYLKSFVVEGFDKRMHKEVIDTQPDVGTEIKGDVKYFEVKNKVVPNKIIRFSMIGLNGEGKMHMCAFRIKLFGILYPNVFYQRVSCRIIRCSTFNSVLSFMIFVS